MIMSFNRFLRLILLIVCLSSVNSAMEQNIYLNDCTIRGADSFVDEYYMWRYVNGGVTPFLWGQFFHDGDEFGLHDAPPQTYSAHFNYRSDEPKTYMELHARYTNDDESSHDFELNQSSTWESHIEDFADFEEECDFAIPYSASEVHIRAKEHSGSDINAQFKLVSIGWSSGTGNWAGSWRGMDFDPGDALGNFDNIHLAHERSSDYVEFVTQMSGLCDLYAYSKKHKSEPANMRIKVNGGVVVENFAIDNTDDYDWWQIWTGNLSAGDIIRIENNQWDEVTSSYLFLSESTLHDSFISFANEPGGAAFSIFPQGASHQPTYIQPQEPVPSVVINNGDQCTGFPDVTLTIENIPSSAQTMKVANQDQNFESVEATLVSNTLAHTLIESSTHQKVKVAFYDQFGKQIKWQVASIDYPAEEQVATDTISVDLATAEMKQFPVDFTAFANFDVTACNISSGVSRLDFFVQPDYELEFSLHDTVYLSGSESCVTVPFAGEPLNAYLFRLRIWDCAGKSRDIMCSEEHPCAWVKVVPHNLTVNVTTLSATSAKFAWENQNWQAFSAYSLYVDTDSPVDTMDANKRAFYTTNMGDNYGPGETGTVVEGLTPGGHYHYTFLAQPADRAQPVMISGEFQMPTYGEQLNLTYERTGPISVRAEWNYLSELSDFSKYRLVLSQAGDTAGPRIFEVADQEITYVDIPGLSQGEDYTMWLEIWNDQESYAESPSVLFTLEVQKAPDLVVDKLQVSQTVPGELANVSFRVRNIGDADLEQPYSSRVYYRAPGAADIEMVNLVEGFGAALSCDLPQGQMNLYQLQLPDNIEVGGTIEAWIDSFPGIPQGVIPELDEDNNIAIYTITSLLPSLPDLNISKVQVFQGDVLADKLLAGHRTKFEVTVRNEGPAECAAFPIAVYYQQLDGADSEQVLLVVMDVEETIASNQSETYILQALLPSSIQNGDMILIVADPKCQDSPNGLVQEVDEDNNLVAIEVSIREPVDQMNAGEDSTLQQMAEAYAELNRMSMAQYYGEENVEVSATGNVTGSEGIISMLVIVNGKYMGTQYIYFEKIDPLGPDKASNWQQVDFKTAI